MTDLYPIPSLATGPSDDESTNIGDESASTPSLFADEINSHAAYPIACLECLRASTSWAIADDVLPMRIACTYNTPNAAASGMLGDLFDVLSIIEDGYSLCMMFDEETPHDEQWNDKYALSSEERQGVARAANACVVAFLVADGAHCEEFGLVGMDFESWLFDGFAFVRFHVQCPQLTWSSQHKINYEIMILHRQHVAIAANPVASCAEAPSLGAAKERFAQVFEAAVAGVERRGGGALDEVGQDNGNMDE
ncbi:hypothetical protein C8A05DRAFT_31517 [Staphylotrichum tortipilum]|uniref:Uncharacterized protein n=1 Tax=Staphylotrichum tortipilum TaxID=2831512 RepID=A0AAN6RV78_9PEZI|nr:hypothetical protein C8A05DRAFT_31517 [Staphylotrichum longicolle]